MKTLLLLLMAACGWAGKAPAAATNDLFANGLSAAQSGDFPQGTQWFRQAAEQQPSAGAFVNLGITEWQRGHAGTAILAWERTLWIDPADDRAKQNLKFARSVAQVDAPQLKWFEAASTWLPPNDWAWLAGAGLWLAIGALTLPGFLRQRKAEWHQWLAALGLGIFLLGLTGNAGVLSRTNLGFVVKKNAPLLLTPTLSGETLATLTAGEPVRKIRARGDFWFVRTASGQGWLRGGDAALIYGQ